MPTSKGVQFSCESPLSSAKGYRNSFLNIQEMRTECLLCATMYSLQPCERNQMLFQNHKAMSDWALGSLL